MELDVEKLIGHLKDSPEGAELLKVKEKYDRKRFELALRHHKEDIDLMREENDEAWKIIKASAKDDPSPA